MPQTKTGVCTIGDLTVRDLASLHILNNALQEAECWIIKCVAREQCSPGALEIASVVTEGPVARIVVVAKSGRNRDCCDLFAHLDTAEVAAASNALVPENESPYSDADLFGINPCGLFRRLIAELNGDWLQILQVHALSIEMPNGTQHKIDSSDASEQRPA
jgi:hypothetical protein